MTLQKDLAEVVRIRNGYLVGDAAYWIEKLKASDSFIERYHAEIAQNAEAARRLAALEQAMGEVDGLWFTNQKELLIWLKHRADEIMREPRK